MLIFIKTWIKINKFNLHFIHWYVNKYGRLMKYIFIFPAIFNSISISKLPFYLYLFHKARQSFVSLAGLWDVRDGLSVQGSLARIHGSLGSTDQEEQTRLAWAPEQCQQEAVRDVQEGSICTLHARSIEDDEER